MYRCCCPSTRTRCPGSNATRRLECTDPHPLTLAQPTLAITPPQSPRALPLAPNAHRQQQNVTALAAVFEIAAGGEAVWVTHPLLLFASLASFGGALVCGTSLLGLAATLGLASTRER